jgi:hypothetical protein
MLHLYDGGGVRASGPALLVRKSLADRVSFSGSVYVDMVSNASIDVVTTASPFKETRTETGVGVDYLVRDSLVSFGLSNSSEPDYKARSASLDIAQDMFGNMTTVNLGFSRGSDKVGKKDEGTIDRATHWQYRAGLTQVLNPRWIASANLELVSDSGLLGSPYRAARVFGAAVPERVPRTRSSRAVKLRAIGDIGRGDDRLAIRGEYRYFWDNWDIRAHTIEVGAARHMGQGWLADVFVRLHRQDKALFYSDNATVETTYISRNRQLSTFNTSGVGGKVTWTLPGAAAQRWDARLTGVFEWKRFDFKDFTDVRNGRPYAHDASVLQLLLTASY